MATLTELASSLDMNPFPLADESRPAYHAGASAAANFVITALATAGDLMISARIDPFVTRPLVEQAVANLYEIVGESPLTGPIARGRYLDCDRTARGGTSDLGLRGRAVQADG